jgi:hypothetical protein
MEKDGGEGEGEGEGEEEEVAGACPSANCGQATSHSERMRERARAGEAAARRTDATSDGCIQRGEAGRLMASDFAAADLKYQGGCGCIVCGGSGGQLQVHVSEREVEKKVKV